VSGSAWPDTPWRMSDEELVEFTQLWLAGRIFAHVHLETWKDLPPPPVNCDPRALRAYADEFAKTWPMWVLYLEAHGAPPESFTEKVGLFWSRSDAMVREGFPDVPRVMHREDFKRVMATLAGEAKEKTDE
jgi:hypothetical protein